MSCLLQIFVILLTCTVHSSLADCVPLSTPNEDEGGIWYPEYLDRQNVKCPFGKAISRFRLNRTGPANTQHYDYTCCDVSISGCQSNATSNDRSGLFRNFGVDALGYQQVGCSQPGDVINAFRLVSSGGVHYNYTCCTLRNNSVTCDWHYTDWDSRGFLGNVALLDRHDVNCPDNGAIGQFFLRISGSRMRYEYTCCNIPFQPCEVPTDRMEDVATCSARHSSVPLNCEYKVTTGTTDTSSKSTTTGVSDTISATTSAGLHFIFGAMLGVSVTTSWNWRSESSSSFQSTTQVTTSFSCPPRTVCTLKQVVGSCGKYVVRSAHYEMYTSDLMATTTMGIQAVQTTPAMFQCSNGKFVLGLYRCDGSADCADASDETNCTQSIAKPLSNSTLSSNITPRVIASVMSNRPSSLPLENNSSNTSNTTVFSSPTNGNNNNQAVS